MAVTQMSPVVIGVPEASLTVPEIVAPYGRWASIPVAGLAEVGETTLAVL